MAILLNLVKNVYVNWYGAWRRRANVPLHGVDTQAVGNVTTSFCIIAVASRDADVPCSLELCELTFDGKLCFRDHTNSAFV